MQRRGQFRDTISRDKHAKQNTHMSIAKRNLYWTTCVIQITSASLRALLPLQARCRGSMGRVRNIVISIICARCCHHGSNNNICIVTFILLRVDVGGVEPRSASTSSHAAWAASRQPRLNLATHNHCRRTCIAKRALLSLTSTTVTAGPPLKSVMAIAAVAGSKDQRRRKHHRCHRHHCFTRHPHAKGREPIRARRAPTPAAKAKRTRHALGGRASQLGG